MYEPQLSDQPDAFGLSRADYAHEVVEVWPENWPAFLLFHSMETQWDCAGMGQRMNLKYLVLYADLDRMGLSAAEFEEMKQDIRTMELAALAAMNDKKD